MKRSMRALALVLAAGLAAPVHAKKAEVTPETFSAKDIEPMKLLKKAPAIVVPGYRVWFTVQDGASAHSGGGGGAKASLSVMLEGVDGQVMQEIADEAFADFMEQLKATGRTIIGPDEVVADEAWADVKPLESPQYDGAKPGKGLGFMIYSPTNVPLWVHHFDQFGGANPFNQKSTKAMYKLSAGKEAVVILPNIVIRFAQVSSSGRSNLSRYAEVGVEPWMAVQMTSSIFQWHAAKPRLGGGAFAKLKTGIPLDPTVGDIVKADEKRGSLGIGSNAPWKSVKASYLYAADPAKYKSESLRGIKAFNRALAQAVAESKK